MKPKYWGKVKSCYMDTDSFIIYIKTKYIYKDIAKDIETKLDSSNHELDRSLLRGKRKP